MKNAFNTLLLALLVVPAFTFAEGEVEANTVETPAVEAPVADAPVEAQAAPVETPAVEAPVADASVAAQDDAQAQVVSVEAQEAKVETPAQVAPVEAQAAPAADAPVADAPVTAQADASAQEAAVEAPAVVEALVVEEVKDEAQVKSLCAQLSTLVANGKALVVDNAQLAWNNHPQATGAVLAIATVGGIYYVYNKWLKKGKKKAVVAYYPW